MPITRMSLEQFEIEMSHTRESFQGCKEEEEHDRQEWFQNLMFGMAGKLGEKLRFMELMK